MAEETQNNNETNEEAPKKSKKKLIIAAALGVLVLAGGAYMFLGHGSSDKKSENSKPVEHTTTLPIPAATANLDNGDGRTIYVKMVANVEFKGSEEMSVLQPKVPEIQDIFQTYLHESRPQDLHGSGFYRLKESILRRLRIQMAPLNVTNVYISELLTQ